MSKNCCRHRLQALQLQPITAHDENVTELRHTSFELKLLPAYRTVVTHFLPNVIMAITKFKSGCRTVDRDTNFV